MYVYILYFRIFCMLFVFFFFILLICRLAVGLFFYNPRVVLYAKFIFAFFLLLLFLLRIHVRRSLHMFIIFYTFRSEGFEFWLSPPRLIAVVVALFDQASRLTHGGHRYRYKCICSYTGRRVCGTTARHMYMKFYTNVQI